MYDALLKFVTKFTKYSVFAQIISVAFFWLLLFFIVDAWLSPFFLSGYQIISYTFIVIIFSAWTTHVFVYKLIESPTPIPWGAQKNHPLPGTSCKLSLKDICEKELKNIAKLASNTVVDNWADDSDDNKKFIQEIQKHVEDVFFALTQKLSKINVESFVKNFILIMHNHVKTNMETRNTIHSTRNIKFQFLHPVSRGEMSVELYLYSLSQTILREFIPGSLQDCSAIFDFTCAAFCSQVFMKFVQTFSQPEVILQSLVEMFESETFPASNCNKSIAVPTEHTLEHCCENLSEISTATQLEEKQETNHCIPNNQPLVEGAPVVPLDCASDLINSSQIDESSYVQTGLSRTLSAATAPLLSSQLAVDAIQPQTQSIQKPNSLPLLTSDEKPDTCDVSSPPVPLSLEGDSSPVYEDNEDFPTAIAKLRSFLEQRNASTGSESTGSKGSSFSPSCDNTRTGSTGGETEGSFEELLEASEQQLDNRIFLNIKIPRTEVCSVPGEGQHSVFLISYDGIYSAVSTSSDESQRDSRLVLKNRTVRRRFRQFRELHSKLTKSEDPVVSQAVRTIRGPNKWQNLPFSRLDQNAVAYRQGFLERYLQELIASPAPGISNELRQFLEYELNLNESNSAPSSAALQRVPFFAKTVSGVLHSIKTALPLTIPGFDNDQNRSVQLVPLHPPSPHCVTFDSSVELKSVQSSLAEDLDADASTVRVTYSTEKCKLEEMLCNWTRREGYVEPAFEALESSLSRNVCSQQSIEVVDGHSRDFCENFATVEDSKTPKVGWDRFDDELPLSSSLINLAVECLSFRESWLVRAPVALIVKVVFGQRIEMFLQESISNFANPNQLSIRLHNFQHKLETGLHTPVDQPSRKQTIDELVMDIVGHLEALLPNFAVWILGKEFCTDVLRSTVSCFTDAQLNRDLALTLLDFLCSQLTSICDS